jgi:hypothetical protein
MANKYSMKKQMVNDYFTFLCFIGFIITSLFLIGIFGFNMTLTKRYGILALDNDMRIVLGIIFGILDILCIMVFILRIRKGKYLVRDGLETEAEIISVSCYKDRGRIEYIYKIENEEYKCGNGISITKTTPEYAIGGKIRILVDQKNRGKAVIRGNFIIE